MPAPPTTQSNPKRADSSEWLALRDAAQLMGVHPATLRAWADRGRIASQRTAGGHRRFSRAELQAWLDVRRSSDAGAQVLIYNALGHIRVDMDQASWLMRFDEETRRAHRELGRRLMQEIARAAAAPEMTDTVRVAAQSIGREYAALSQRQSLALGDALRAFLFFRDHIVDSLVQMAGALEPIATPSWPTVHRHLSTFLNEVLLALVQAYEEGRGD